MEAIEYTRRKGGNLIIPAFAVERTQDLIYDLNLLYQQGRLPKEQKIYIDSSGDCSHQISMQCRVLNNETRQLDEGPTLLPNRILRLESWLK